MADLWQLLPPLLGPGAKAYRHSMLDLQVIITEERLSDGMLWRHVSVTGPDRYPTWEEIKMVKDRFIGVEEDAVQVLPKKSRYVNVHPHCFHIWHNLSGITMPE